MNRAPSLRSTRLSAMATNYPGSKQTFTDPSGTSLLTNPDHAGLHADMNDTMEAVQDKLGVGSGTPTSGRILTGTGNGTSSWGTSYDNGAMGSPTITGGTLIGSRINNGTLGTPAITAGVINGATLGTPAINNFSSGTHNHTSTAQGGSLILGQNSSAKVYNSTNQSIADNTETTLTFDTEAWDTDAIHGTANTGRLTIPSGQDGKWFIDAQVVLDADADNSRYMLIRQNGGTQVARAVTRPDPAFGPAFGCHTIMNAVAGDYFEIRVFQNGGGTLGAVAGVGNTFFECHRWS